MSIKIKLFKTTAITSFGVMPLSAVAAIAFDPVLFVVTSLGFGVWQWALMNLRRHNPYRISVGSYKEKLAIKISRRYWVDWPTIDIMESVGSYSKKVESTRSTFVFRIFDVGDDEKLVQGIVDAKAEIDSWIERKTDMEKARARGQKLLRS